MAPFSINLPLTTLSANGTRPRQIVNVKPISVTPLIAIGNVIQPTIVAIKIASMCQAWTVTPAGLIGAVNQKTNPSKTGKINFL